MQKAGAYLRSIREDKGYTIQEISKATKLSSSVIRALEEGRIDNVDPVYLKGFLKLYCRYLGLSWEVFISEHNIPALAKKQQKSFSTKPKAPAQRAAPAKGGFSFLKLISANSFGHKRPNYGPVANKKFIAMILTAVAVVLLAAIIFRGRVFILKKFPKIELPKVNQLKPEKQKAREPDKQAKPAPAKRALF